ncbi:hypothetical protein KR093_006144 [Drosophila rubida]|uniref:Ataxin-2 C-terminal domain-containing protein n=1 Tax=Drosophila rubida TaxID=30044 RepID=A0AAD4JTL1_9MUSC|nr:hypothetical protein KR093_006144 [Drosophila rubida]
MEHEDNAHFDNFLQNRLTESLQNAGSNNNAGNNVADAAELVANIGPKSGGEHDAEHDDEEEWKYKEVQQSEKQQQQQLQYGYGEKFNDVDVDADVDVAFGVGVGNGISIGNVANVGNGHGVGGSSDAYMSLGMDLSLGNGVGSGVGVGSAGFRAYEEEEDVEVIKNDGDFSTNSNTTTTTSTTGEVKPANDNDVDGDEAAEQLLCNKEQQLPLDVEEEEEEPSSVATTYGTSSLSEHQQEQEPEPVESVAAQPPVFFDNKENADPVEPELELESHSQLNPNAVEFVPHFGSQPASPAPNSPSPTPHMAAIVDPMQSLGRQLLVDDLVAESPRKGTRDCNMDTIALPDEREFDDEAAQRPHELELEDDTFPDASELQNGSNVYQQDQEQEQEQQPRLDHGPETSVDLDADLELEPQQQLQQVEQKDDDIMKQSIYGESITNASIEDILNSVQPLPQQGSSEEPLKEKELLNVEEKELVSQSPSIEELHQHQLHQPVDPMQASFYLEHTSSDAAFTSDVIEHEQSLLLDTSAPMFSPLEDSPHHDIETAPTLELQPEPEQADIVDITPSPLSTSTEEKHLVEETKEQQQNPADEEPLVVSENIQNTLNAGVPPQVSLLSNELSN